MPPSRAQRPRCTRTTNLIGKFTNFYTPWVAATSYDALAQNLSPWIVRIGVVVGF